jgi:hypothetical protein
VGVQHKTKVRDVDDVPTKLNTSTAEKESPFFWHNDLFVAWCGPLFTGRDAKEAASRKQAAYHHDTYKHRYAFDL